ncbi:MAG TPA: NUDIX hydrolase [Thermoplasmata archaeon]|nr:NUDIX hydrolase [Thermoplasmata archaeon]
MAVPRVAVDAIVLHRGKLVLVKRGTPPFLGQYALPGGGVEFRERLEDAVEREVREETGLVAETVRLLGVYGDPDRDPRGHTISIAYVLNSIGGRLKAGTDASDAKLVPLTRVPRLAFDHSRIVEDYRRSLKG